MRLINTFFTCAASAGLFSLLLGGCASASSDDIQTDEEALRKAKASEGEACGDGVFGRPKKDCRAGLECITPESDGPSGPPGAAGSARAGRCEVRADEGDTCGDGMMGRPNIACRSGLSCVTPRGVSGPPGARGSLRAGHCQRFAGHNEPCGEGVFGTPAIACGAGLACVYPAGGTAPDNDSAAARMGHCVPRG